MNTVYHIYKTNCHKSSRIYMQTQWAKKNYYLHKDINKNKNNEETLNHYNHLRVLYNKNKKSLIYHAQSSLIYLIVAIILNKTKKNKVIYDMHDLLEYNMNEAKYYKKLRYMILSMLENIVINNSNVQTITVSNGLSNIVKKKYSANKPLVVKSVVKSQLLDLDNRHRRINELIYFGQYSHAPIEIIDKCDELGICIDLFGRDITNEKIYNDLGKIPDNISIYGEYQPDELKFLKNYKYLLLYNNKNKINYKYSQPNKVFQSLSFGMSILISPNFREIYDTFKSLDGAVAVIENIDDIPYIINAVDKERGHDYNIRAMEFLEALYKENKIKFQRIVN